MNQLISYAYDFVSYLLLQPDIKKYPINKIILFGSSIRGDYTNKSDIDLFIDAETKNTELKTELEKYKTAFLSSKRLEKWKNIKSEFSIIVDSLEKTKWQELRKSMHSHAILIYERYSDTKNKDIKPYSIITWEIGSNNPNKRVNLARKLYGYKQKGKLYPGILKEINAQKISDGVIIIPSDHTNRLRDIFNKLNIKYKIKDIFY